MIEAACVVRAALQDYGCECIFMWCPGHCIPFNSMADAVAKASLAKPWVDVTSWVAGAVHSRPCVYTREGAGGWALRNGPLHREVMETMGVWVRRELIGQARSGRWEGVVTCVAQAKGRRKPKGEMVDDDEWRMLHAKRVRRQRVTHEMRANDARWVEQGAGWARRLRDARKKGVESRETVEAERGCAACGAERCDMCHVVMAGCAGVQARYTYLKSLRAAIDGVREVLPRVSVECPCVAQVRRASAAVLRAQRNSHVACDMAAFAVSKGRYWGYATCECGG